MAMAPPFLPRSAANAGALVALLCATSASAFAPGTQVRSRTLPLPLPQQGGGSVGALAPPSALRAARHSAQSAPAPAANLLSAEFPQQQKPYDDTEFFEGFMTSVLDKVNEREDSEMWRATAKTRGIARLMDTIVTIAACMMAMQFFGMWMALGVWAWRRAADVAKSTSAAASSAQALFVAFASGSPLDRASRENVLASRFKGRRKAQDGPVLTLRHADGSVVRDAPTDRRPQESVAWGAYRARQMHRLTGAKGSEKSGSATIMESMREPADPEKEEELREQARREREAREMRAEMLQLTKDIAFIANYHARKAAIAGAQRVTQVATSPDTRKAMVAAVGFVATTGVASALLDRLSASAHS